MKKYPAVEKFLSGICPGLKEKIRAVILKSEREYTGRSARDGGGFLWAHSMQVAAFAFRISRMEKSDPLVPVITALFHDSGKFISGGYHCDDIPEENHSAAIARRILKKENIPDDQAAKVIEALNSLYQERGSCSQACRIVHDADFMDKFGYVGISNFFIKSTLRGRPLDEAILSSLSKELTYSASAYLNMMTGSGRKLARQRSSLSIKFYTRLIRELEEFEMGFYSIKRVRPFRMNGVKLRREKSRIEIYLVEPQSCLICGGSFSRGFSVKKDVKCEKIIAETICSSCGKSYKTEFCLPEIYRGCV